MGISTPTATPAASSAEPEEKTSPDLAIHFMYIQLHHPLRVPDVPDALAAMLRQRPTSTGAERLFRFSLVHLAIVFAAAALAAG